VTGSSVLVVVGEMGRWESVSAGSDRLDPLDQRQHQTGEGPGVDASAEGKEPVVVVSTGRYPHLKAAAAEAGIRFVYQAQSAKLNITRGSASRSVIGPAQGVLLLLEHISPEQALDILRRASQHTNLRLRDLAAELVAKTSTANRPEVVRNGDP
jgi:ANTAR domain